MSAETVDAIAELTNALLADNRVDIVLAGGDPSAHPEFVEITRHFATISQTHVITHGLTLDKKTIDAFGERPIRMQFSIPSPDAARYGFLTGGGQLDAALSSALWAKDADLPISISSVITQMNAQDTEGLAYMALELGAEYLILNQFLPAGRGVMYADTLGLDDASFAIAVRQARNAARGTPLRIGTSGALPGVRDRKLSSPKLTISVTGDMQVCSLDTHSIGHVSDNADDLMRRYDQFWRSGSVLPLCLCSQMPLSLAHAAPVATAFID